VPSECHRNAPERPTTGVFSPVRVSPAQRVFRVSTGLVAPPIGITRRGASGPRRRGGPTRMRAKGPRSLYKPRFYPPVGRYTASPLFALPSASTRVCEAPNRRSGGRTVTGDRCDRSSRVFSIRACEENLILLSHLSPVTQRRQCSGGETVKPVKP